MKNMVQIKNLAEEILRCDRELEKFQIFDYSASDEDVGKDKGDRPAINVKIESPGAHIVIYALARIEIDCIRSTLNAILWARKQTLTKELDNIFSNKET